MNFPGVKLFGLGVVVATLAGLPSLEGAVQNTSTIQGIKDTCYAFLEEHLCEGEKWNLPFHFYRPSLEKYSPDQWLWDSGSHMIVWSHKNVSNSILDLRTMLQMQQPDGRIPEQIFWGPRDAMGEASILKQYSNTKVTDITQMPVLAHSLRSIYNQTGDLGLLKEFVYPLIDYFHWWRNARDLGDGLVVIVHNWESGLDASPAYDEAFHVEVTEVNKTAWARLYPKFHQLIKTYKYKYDWNITAILERKSAPDLPGQFDNWYVMKDAALNSVYAAGWGILGALARELGDESAAKVCEKEYAISRDAILTKMWQPALNRFSTLFVDWDGVEKSSKANTVQNLFPLLLPDLPAEMVRAIVEQIESQTKFGTPFPVSTVARDDPAFCPTFDADLMWRGPVWGFTNWFVMEGLATHGFWDLQGSILDRWIALVKQSGIYEHYNPLTGEPYGAVGLGMSTLICDYVYRYGL